MPAETQPSAVSRTALVILAVIAAGAVMFWLRDILTPLALAMFLAIMIDSFARVLHERAKVSSRVAMPLAILLSLLIVVGTVFFVAENATSFATQLINYAPKMNGVIERLAGLVGVEAPPSFNQLVSQLNPQRYLGSLAMGAQSFLSTAGFVLVYTGFIMVSRRGFQKKIDGLFPVARDRREAIVVFRRIRNGVEQYLWVQTVTGLMIAGTSWLAMVAVGLNDAAFWAFLIFLASYIPIIGAVIGVAGPPIFALVQFDTLWQAIVLFSILQTITLVVGNLIYPRMQSRSVNIDPVVVLLALAFWSAIWGVTGAFLSTPLAVMMMVVLAQFDGTRWVAVLMSDDGDPLERRDGEEEDGSDPPLKRTTRATARRKAPARRGSSKA